MNFPHTSRLLQAAKACLFIWCVTTALASPVNAKEPGRGRTAAFEVDYLKFIIDHHYSALRITELAAGTDGTRDAAISPEEGISPTPQFETTAAKAQLDSIKSMARRDNRVQREEILMAQEFLREWYGINYQPRLRPGGQQLISTLEATAAGATFDKAFLQVFSRHHYLAVGPSLQCVTGADVAHLELERYCRSIVEMQMTEIDEMRHMLCERFSQCDYQPFNSQVNRREDTDANWTQE